MQTWLTEHDCGNIYLFMNPDIFASEYIDVLPEIPDDEFCTIGYPDEMALVYPIREDSCKFSLRDSVFLPHSEAKDTQNIYQFCPLRLLFRFFRDVWSKRNQLESCSQMQII